MFCGFCLFLLEEKNEINGLDFNNIGDAFVTGGRDLCVRMYDVQTSNVRF